MDVDINEAILNTEFENIDIVASATELAGCRNRAYINEKVESIY